MVENKILKILVNVCSYLPLTSCSTVGISQNKSKNNELGLWPISVTTSQGWVKLFNIDLAI